MNRRREPDCATVCLPLKETESNPLRLASFQLFARFLVRYFCFLILFLAAQNGLALLAPVQNLLPDFKPAPAEASVPAADFQERQDALRVLRNRLPKVVVDLDPQTGSPRRILATESFLTGSNGIGKAVSGKGAVGLAADHPQRAIRAFLSEHERLFGFGPEALDQARVRRDHVFPHNGLHTIVWEQQVQGIPVFEAVLIAHTTKAGELVSVSSRFVPDPDGAATRGVPQRVAWVERPPIEARKAVALAAANLGESAAPEALTAEPLSGSSGAANRSVQRQSFRGAALKGAADASLVWLALGRDRMRLCWETLLTTRARGELYRVLVDVETGEPLLRHCLTEHVSDASFRIFTGDSPTPFSPGEMVDTNSIQPAWAVRELVTLSALDTNASPAGWIPDGVNETRGNNVDAHADANDDNLPDLPRPQGVPWRVFDKPLLNHPPLDLVSQDPTNYTDVAVVQLFYWCNWMHDRLYQLGFTESAGNFQADNFGRGGLAGDPLLADAQDGSGFDNANMSTPPEGSSPRMQMYVFSGPEPRRDGDLDAEVILHEYTHGLSERTVGGGVGISLLQPAGMGEGWSDFYAMALLSRPEDDVDGCYATGAYVSYALIWGFEANYYFGIRRYPYSTDQSKNPLTFKDIDPALASDHVGVSINPAILSIPNEVHNIGEVWCVTLWEARANLIRKYGWEKGNELMLQLVTDGMMLSPPNPTFLEARDAMLLADLVNELGANQRELWAAFAKRGMGCRAVAPPSSDTLGVVESYEVPDSLQISPFGDLVIQGATGGPFRPASLFFTLTNSGMVGLDWTLSSSVPWLSLSQTQGTLLAAGPATQVVVSPSVGVAFLPVGRYSATLWFTNASNGLGFSRTVTLGVGLPDYFTEAFDSGDNDLAFQTFTFTPDGSPSFYGVCRQAASQLPTDPTGGFGVSLLDDGFAPATLTGGKSVAIYQTRANQLFIGSNGYLTLGAGDTSYVPSLGTHFSQPRVAAWFDDLNPTLAGAVSYKQLDDRVAVTYLGVPEYGAASRTNTFQIELFFDGRIRVTYLTLRSTDGLAGLSAGDGVPPDFLESDLTSLVGCRAHLSVTVPSYATEGSGLQVGAAQVQLPFPLATNLIVSLSAGDAALVGLPSSVLIPAGMTHAACDITVFDDAVLTGPRTIGIDALAPGFDPGHAGLPVWDNETATVQVLLPETVLKTQGVLQTTARLSAAPVMDVLILLASSVPSVVQVPRAVFVPAGQTDVVFPVQISAIPHRTGDETVVVSARVDGWPKAWATLKVIDPAAAHLALTFFGPVVEGSGTVAHAGQVSLPGILTSNLQIEFSSGDSARVQPPATLTIPAGQQSATFGLNLGGDSLAQGDQSVTLSVAAPGFAPASNSLFVVDDDVAPSILLSPSDQVALAGGTVSLAVEAFGAVPLTYQWRFNGVDLPAATTNPLVLNNLLLSQVGTYSVLVTNSIGSALSPGVRLDVLPAAAGQILIFSDGTELTVSPFAQAMVELGLSYRFFGVSAEKEFNRALISVEPTNTLLIVDVSLYSYDFAPVIDFVARGGRAVLQYWNLANDEELASAFGVRVEREFVVSPRLWDWTGPLFLGTSNPIFLEDLFSDVNGYTLRPLPGAAPVAGFSSNAAPTLAAIVIGNSNRTLVDGFLLSAIEKPGDAVTMAKNHILLAVGNWPVTNPPSVLVAPVDLAVALDGHATLSVLAGGSLPLKYQWRKNGFDLSDGPRICGAQAPSLTLSNVVEADAGVYSVAVSNAFGATQAAAQLLVRAVDHLVWQPLAQPQVAGVPFDVSIQARTVQDQVWTGFNATVLLSAAEYGAADRDLLGTPSNPSSASGDYTLGQAFTPSTNLLVTHVRHFFGGKVSLWTESGTLLLAQTVTNLGGNWLETPLASPLPLKAGKRYRLAAYSHSGPYYWRSDLSAAFPDGSLHQSYYAEGDAFPDGPTSARWWFVDLRYAVAAQVPLAPSVSGNFQHGVWNGSLTVPQTGSNLILVAEDALGAWGLSQPLQFVNAPSLQMGQFGSALLIFWPAISSRYVLEVSPSLAPADWLPMPYPPVPIGGYYVVPAPMDQPSGFYRLRVIP